MCLVTKQSEPTIATEDITCYKLLIQVTSECLMSPIRHFIWELNKLYKTKLVSKLNPRGIRIFENPFSDRISSTHYGWNFLYSEDYGLLSFDATVISYGFHGATTTDRIKQMLSYDKKGSVIAKCIIPKGSEYFLDETNLIVSNKIKII